LILVFENMIPRILIIAGSDSGGGAGVQADIKAVAAHGGYAATAITAITVQNTLGVHNIFAIPPDIIAQQITAVLDDIGADIIKIGMLGDVATINSVATTLRQYPQIPIILDTVMRAKGGTALLAEDAIFAMTNELLPLATLITPNIPEAETLLGRAITNIDDMQRAASSLSDFGTSVLLKGGHMMGDILLDILLHQGELHEFRTNRIYTLNTHGTGCTMASAIATLLAHGVPMVEAVRSSQSYVHGAIMSAPNFGGGHGPLWHGWQT
jgi:hydroxymethylpyrimidine/phosphomethylpyrimidine kinase